MDAGTDSDIAKSEANLAEHKQAQRVAQEAMLARNREQQATTRQSTRHGMRAPLLGRRGTIGMGDAERSWRFMVTEQQVSASQTAGWR